MSAAFTKGPCRLGADLSRVHPEWRDEGGSITADTLHRNGYAKTIATIGKEHDWRDIEQFVADGHLIAAAPELYEALSVITINAGLIPDPATGESTDCYAVPIDDIEAAIAALARARGEHD